MDLNPEFIEMLRGLGPDFDGLEHAILHTEPSVSVRVNRAKGYDSPLPDQVPWCADGFYLPERPQFTLDPALHQGLYYPQDASSMAIVPAVEQAVEALGMTDRPLRYLDACAAPGGKTTAAMSALPSGSFVVANEYDPRRTSILCENIAKWGIPGAVITRGDASSIRGLDGFFDIIAADVPCSGEGMMRKDPVAREQWSAALVTECAARQRDITDALWQALRPGGFMIYSTCTFNREENEDIIGRLAEKYGAEGIEINALKWPEIARETSGNLPAYHFLPGRVRGEGQFVALLRKPDEGDVYTIRPDKGKNKPEKTKKIEIGALPSTFILRQGADGSVTALLKEHDALVDAIGKRMHIVSAGIECGTVKGHDFIPAQPLALSTAYLRGAYPEVEIDREKALDYLRREAIAIDGPKGIVLLTYGGKPLGWVKNLGNRANNLYPQAWRILSRR